MRAHPADELVWAGLQAGLPGADTSDMAHGRKRSIARSTGMRFRGLSLAVGVLVGVIGSPAPPAGAVRDAPPPAPHAPHVALPAPVLCPGCWHPEVQTSWQWQLTGTIDTSIDVEMYDVDLFEVPKATVAELQGDGRHVVCYISAGSLENWRPDASAFPKVVVGNKYEGWAGERWLDIRRWDILGPIMTARMDLCASKGFDGIEFDNMEGFHEKTGFPLTAADQLLFNARMANAAHERGLSTIAKNDLGQLATLLPYFDAALNEECFQWKECSKLSVFVAAGKPVFQVEYQLETSQFCSKANALNFNSLKKKLALKVWRVPCR